MPARGLIIAHANLAQAFLATVEQIAGPQEGMLALSNTELSNEGLEKRIRKFLESGGPAVIFTDFNAGSTFALARSIVNEHCLAGGAACTAVTGVNLPMLLSFITKRARLSFDELVTVLREDGHRGIQ